MLEKERQNREYLQMLELARMKQAMSDLANDFEKDIMNGAMFIGVMFICVVMLSCVLRKCFCKRNVSGKWKRETNTGRLSSRF